MLEAGYRNLKIKTSNEIKWWVHDLNNFKSSCWFNT
uniref:Uncharacterized protein n=1 Tax=Triparma laevis TaxID=1534972 RepID=A0A0K2RWR4_9STRA|nr:hypothetical protein AL373_pgp112 [Triparma laevis]BAS19047.1 hypothetical protein [Triparma laevis]